MPTPRRHETRRSRWWRRTKEVADVPLSCPDGCGDGCGDDLGCDGCDLGCDGPCLIGLVTLGFASLRTVPATSAAAAPAGVVTGFMWRRVRAYQLYVSAQRPPCCPMTPTCSRYALDALHRHGAARGLLLTVRRLRRCRPGRPHGLDPVPPAR